MEKFNWFPRKNPLVATLVRQGFQSLPDRSPYYKPMRQAYVLRQISAPHQIKVALPGHAAPFINRPNNQTLSPATVPSRENSRNAGCIFFVLGFDIAAGVAFQSQRIQQRLFRAEEAHR